MEPLTQENGSSLNIVNENLKALKTLFPEAFAEDGVDFETLRQLLGDAVAASEEKYGLMWNGKARAQQIALTPSLGTLRPCPEESIDWNTTQNLFIEGDNLEVLKLLQRSYAGKVKMIYIDPPYNTGNEFIYPDKFQESLETYLKFAGLKDDEGNVTSSMAKNKNTVDGARYHTNWLNMMYPRLKIARELLHEGGAIFISIDDHEQTNLKKLCDQIFSEDCFVANIVWKKKTGAGSGIQHVFDEHEYVLVYSKNKSVMAKWRISSEDDGNFRNPDNDERGNWESCAFTAPSKNRNPNQLYMIEVHYDSANMEVPTLDSEGRSYFETFSYLGHKVVLRDVLDTDALDYTYYDQGEGVAKFIRRWAYAKQNVSQIFEQRKVYFNNGNIPRFKKFESEYEGKAVRSIYFDEFSTQQGTDAMRELFGESLVEYPKPVGLIKHFSEAVLTEDAVILDFFSGSCTTAHALLELNREDTGNRKFIMVQLPEPTDEGSEAYEAGYETIADIGKERIRRAAAKIKEENPEYEGDLGFKVFKLDSSNIRAWNPDRDDLEKTLMDHAEHLVEGRSEEDVLYELLLKRGVELTVPIERQTIAGKTVYSIGYGVLFACLDTTIGREDVEDLALGIVAWREALAPATDTQVVFRDSAFANDVTKTNMTAILEQHGIAHVRSL